MNNISIYMGTQCNFNCNYCDRSYLKKENLYQSLDIADIPKIVQYIKNNQDYNMVSFHGGEPMLFVKEIQMIIDEVNKFKPETQYFLQTNGSKILDNIDFFKNNNIMVSISYDFITQETNRRYIDILSTLEVLKTNNIRVQLQSVIDSQSDFFKEYHVLEIINLVKKYNVAQLDFITLRHIRGKDNFKVVIDDVNIPQLNDYFADMAQALILMNQFNIDIYIDGAVVSLDEHKKYLTKEDAKLLVLSPNGNVYTEYDFLDYNVDTFAVDNWKDSNTREIAFNLNKDCEVCSVNHLCGLKYLIGLFNKETPRNCVHFYSQMNAIHQFNSFLKNNNISKLLVDSYDYNTNN